MILAPFVYHGEGFIKSPPKRDFGEIKEPYKLVAPGRKHVGYIAVVPVVNMIARDEVTKRFRGSEEGGWVLEAREVASERDAEFRSELPITVPETTWSATQSVGNRKKNSLPRCCCCIYILLSFVNRPKRPLFKVIADGPWARFDRVVLWNSHRETVSCPMPSHVVKT